MKISIITVTYNCESTLEKTMKSVLLQSGLKKAHIQTEYLIVDGRSKDATVKIAEKYRPLFEEKGITFKVMSEPDGGIYDAMNKGILWAGGEIIGILNSGDWYEKNTLETVADAFQKKQCDLLFGNLRIHKNNGTSFVKKARLRKYQTSRDWNHPTTFVKASILKENLFLNKGIHDDYGFFLKMRRQNRNIIVLDQTLANFTMGGVSNQKSFQAAEKRIRDRYLYCYRANGYSRGYFLECVAMEVAKWILG